MPDLKDIIKEVFDAEETKEEAPTEAETPPGLLEILKEVFGDDTKE